MMIHMVKQIIQINPYQEHHMRDNHNHNDQPCPSYSNQNSLPLQRGNWDISMILQLELCFSTARDLSSRSLGPGPLGLGVLFQTFCRLSTYSQSFPLAVF